MDCFIKKIFLGKADDSVHNQFTRFGKGIYKNRAAVKFMRGKEELSVSGTFEYSNDFVSLICELGKSAKVSGKVLSKQDISGLMKKNNIKGNSETKSGGLYYENNIDEQEIAGDKLNEIVGSSYASLLDIEGEGFSLKIKKKLPKPGKGDDAKIDDKFCVLKTSLANEKKAKEMFFWDIEEAKKIFVKHEFQITDLVMPKGIDDFAKLRLLTKRKGKIIRNVEADKKPTITDMNFEA